MRAVRSALFLGSVLSLTACGGTELETAVESAAVGQLRAPLHLAEAGQAIADAYIIKVKDGAEARAVAAVAGVEPRQVYSTVNAFAATLNAGQLEALRSHPEVEYVEQDQVMLGNTTQSSATWGLDRIDQRSLPLSGTYNYTRTCAGVYAYIIDTGIDSDHPQFGGRAKNVYDAFGGTGEDCNGHGTHVAGTVGSSTYGVCKSIYLRGVRVLDCNGSGSISGVISGVDWVRTNHIKPAVAVMSLGGGYSSTLNTAVNNLANAGVFVVVAAGNSGGDACNSSPSSATYACTVAASTNTDYRATYSNYGSCVDLYAPGSSITSAWVGGGTNTISGTSMAAPHVAGVGALYKSTYGDASSSTVDSWIKNNSTANVIKSNVTGTPNRLLYKSSL